MAEVAVAQAVQPDHAVWKILVVDDEPAIHQVTKLALRNLSVLGRPSQLINALSAKDAREQLARHPDIAVILLDVVMETENAGLEFIQHIRERANNPLVRIILRTGQPGQAPERQLMVDYDINDYKEKTELTAAKLFTTVMSSIRTFSHLQSMESSRRALEVLGRLNSAVFAASDSAALAQALVAQLGDLQLFNGISSWTDGGVVASTAPGSAQAQHSMLQKALDKPGTLIAEDALVAVSLTLAKGQALTLCMSASQALAGPELHVLKLWLGSARAVLAHWDPAH